MAWKVDFAHSKVYFAVRHMMISTVRGGFDKFDVELNYDEHVPANSTVTAKIEAASINTGVADRDNHLRSGDFLDAQNHPYLTFKSKKVDIVDSNHARITGDLTIRDVSNQVVLDVEYSGVIKSPFGAEVVGFAAQTKINRKDWNLVWNMVIESGALLVGEDITINIEVEFARVVEPVPTQAQTA